MKSSIALLCFSILFQFASAEFEPLADKGNSKSIIGDKMLRPLPECAIELCDMVVGSKDNGSFKDEYQFGHRCSCTKGVELNKIARPIINCEKTRKVEDGKVTDSWICNQLMRVLTKQPKH